MKNKGFTLIELMGMIVVILLIAIISVPIINNTIKNSKEKTYETLKSKILEAAKIWGADNTNFLPEQIDQATYYLKLNELTGKYLDGKDIIDPRTNETMTGCVKIVYTTANDNYSFTYSDTCN